MLDGWSPSPSPSWSWSLSTHTKAMPHGYLWHICTLLLNMKLGHYKPNHNHGREIFSMNTKANARWSALIFIFSIYTCLHIYYILLYVYTHTYTHMQRQQTFCIYEQHQWKLIIIIGISIIEPVGRRVRPHVRGRRPRAMILMLFTMLKTTTTTTTMTTRRAGCVAKGVKLYDLQWPLGLQDLHASGSTHTYMHECVCVCVLWMWLHR